MTSDAQSARNKIAWQVRRARHGPSGGNVGGERWHTARCDQVTMSPPTPTPSPADTNAPTQVVEKPPWLNTQKMSMFSMQVLPANFDDDTRVAEVTLRNHPPRAWLTA